MRNRGIRLLSNGIHTPPHISPTSLHSHLSPQTLSPPTFNSFDHGWQRMFGGQVCAQVLASCSGDVETIHRAAPVTSFNGRNEANCPSTSSASRGNEAKRPSTSLASLGNEANHPSTLLASRSNEANHPSTLLASLGNEANHSSTLFASLNNEANHPSTLLASRGDEASHFSAASFASRSGDIDANHPSAVLLASRGGNVEAHRPAASLRVRFLMFGDPTRYVEHFPVVAKETKSFTWFKVDSKQDDKLIATSVVCRMSRKPGAGIVDHDDSLRNRVLMEKVPKVEECEDALSLFGFEMKSKVMNRGRVTWMKLKDDKQVWGPNAMQAAAAFASDYYFLRSALERHDLEFWNPTVRAASLCHSMFFHGKNLDLTKWTAFVCHSPLGKDGRSLVEGQFLNSEGERVATVVQEGMTLRTIQQDDVVVSRSVRSSINAVRSSEPPSVIKQTTELEKLITSVEGEDSMADGKCFGWQRQYGGLLLAQGLMSARKRALGHGEDEYRANPNLLDSEIACHSIHAHFLKAGDPSLPTKFESRLDRAGKVFTSVSVVGAQNHNPKKPNEGDFIMNASFFASPKHERPIPDEATKKIKFEGLEHDDDVDPQSKDRFEAMRKDDLPEYVERNYAMPYPLRSNLMAKMGIDYRADFRFECPDNMQRAYVKLSDGFDWNTERSQTFDQALLMYASDCVFPPSATLRYKLNMWNSQMQVASLCASYFFHRKFRFEKHEWISIRSQCPVIKDDRAFVKMDIFTNWGQTRIATAVQEVLVRANPKRQ